MRNIDQVRGYLQVLEAELNDPSKAANHGNLEEWDSLTRQLDANLLVLKDFIQGNSGEAE